ncbi:MAG: LysM peptidoglycan-binding domain-containing protein [Anaerolineaceae bacterium]|nr:LysM peptidoglycan-binding domain-containing protein [Anaerolineaceae bacterium]
MKRNVFGALIVIIIGAFLLTACERSATRAPGDGDIPTPDPTQSQIMQDILSATQTAQAADPNSVGPTQPPQPEEPPEPEPTPGLPATYTIKANEFLFCIARRYNVDVAEFLAINGLGMDYYAQVGDRLTIPQSGKPFVGQRSLRPHPADYTVVAGDTIGKIACLFGEVTPEAILAANGLESGAKLEPGQVLDIP